MGLCSRGRSLQGLSPPAHPGLAHSPGDPSCGTKQWKWHTMLSGRIMGWREAGAGPSTLGGPGGRWICNGVRSWGAEMLTRGPIKSALFHFCPRSPGSREQARQLCPDPGHYCKSGSRSQPPVSGKRKRSLRSTHFYLVEM